MKKFILIISLLGALNLSAFEFDNTYYTTISAGAILPRDSSHMRHKVGSTISFGVYLTERFALELETGIYEDKPSLAVRSLCHFGAWEEFDLLFGCERFDPFFTFGAAGWFNGGQYGPSAGVGAYYYLSDFWAIRFEGSSLLALNEDTSVVYSLSIGIQRTF